MDNRREYTEQYIRNWRQELTSIPEQIELLRNSIKPHTAKLNELNPELAKLKADQIAPSRHKIEGMEAQIEVLTIPDKITSLQQQIIPYQEKLDMLQPQFDTVTNKLVPVDNDIRSLTAMIAIKEAQQIIEAQRPIVQTHESQLMSLRPQLDAVNASIYQLSSHISSVQSRLASLEAIEAADRAAHEMRRYQHQQHNRHHHDFHHHHHHHQPSVFHVTADIGEFVGDVARNAEISRLRRELQSDYQAKVGIEAQQCQLQASVTHHQREFAGAQNKISQAQSQLNRYDYQTIQAAQRESYFLLIDRLRLRKAEKDALEYEKSNLLSQINLNDSAKNKLVNKISSLRQDLKDSKRDAVEYADNQDVNDLRLKLTDEKKIQNNLQAEKTRLDSDISQHNYAITDAENKIQHHQSRQAQLQSNQFLMKLYDSPQILFKALSESLIARCEEYDETHPAGQSVEVRICLAELKNKIHSIQFQQAEGAQNNSVNKRQYYQLCGLVHDMANRVQANPENHLFLAEITASLGQEVLEKSVCLTEYNTLHLETMSQEQLHTYEENEYEKEKENFKQALETAGSHGLEDLHRKGNLLCDGIEHSKQEAPREGQPPKDVKYLTATLKRAAVLASKPEDVRSPFRFHNLIKYSHDGKPRLGLKLLGLAVGFLGAVLVVASIAAKIMTLGVSTPLSTAGIVVGGAMMLAGIGIFRKGMRSGFSKQQVDFEQEAKRRKISQITTKTPLLFPPSASSNPVSTDEGSEPGTMFAPGGPSIIEPSAPALSIV